MKLSYRLPKVWKKIQVLPVFRIFVPTLTNIHQSGKVARKWPFIVLKPNIGNFSFNIPLLWDRISKTITVSSCKLSMNLQFDSSCRLSPSLQSKPT